MAKAKHPKLPNGFGSIKKLSGKNRTNPYGVYPPTTEFTLDGSPTSQKALCYVPDWYTGFYALMEYKNGTFDANNYINVKIEPSEKNNDVINKIIASYNMKQFSSRNKKTFSEVYKLFYAHKYEREGAKALSRQSRDSTNSAYKNCSTLHNMPFDEITADQLQKNLDDCPLAYSSKELILSLYRQMYKYAFSNKLCERDISVGITINIPDDDEKGVPFTPEDIKTFWKHKDDNSMVKCILIMIYTGFRISEYKTLEIDTKNKCFVGGMKTSAGKGRTVPFYKPIIPLLDSKLELFSLGSYAIRKNFYIELKRLGIDATHTPHDTRHTFSWLCDSYKVDMISKKIMLGHSLGKDVTNSRYGHRTIEQLRKEINKIDKDCKNLS